MISTYITFFTQALVTTLLMLDISGGLSSKAKGFFSELSIDIDALRTETETESGHENTGAGAVRLGNIGTTKKKACGMRSYRC